MDVKALYMKTEFLLKSRFYYVKPVVELFNGREMEDALKTTPKIIPL